MVASLSNYSTVLVVGFEKNFFENLHGYLPEAPKMEVL